MVKSTALKEGYREYWIGRTKNSNKIERKTVSFSRLARACLQPKIARITQTAYKELPDKEKKHVKDSPYIMPGAYRSPEHHCTRSTANIKYIELLIIDIDDPLDAERVYDTLYLEVYLEHRDINYICFPTFSSTPQFKRVRLMVDAHQLPTQDYIRGITTVCHWLNVKPSKESLIPNQLMYLPHICKDAEYESIHYTDGKPYTSDMYEPESDTLLQSTRPYLSGIQGIAQVNDSEIDQYYEPPLTMAPETFIDALMHVSPEVEYPEWVRRAYSQKHFWQHDDDRGLEVFDQWSQKDDCSLYTGYEDCKRLWNNIKAHPVGRKPITGRYVVELAQNAGWMQKVHTEASQQQLELDVDHQPVYPKYIKDLLQNYAYLKFDKKFINLSEINPSLIAKESFNHEHQYRCWSSLDYTKEGKLSKRTGKPKLQASDWLSIKHGKMYESIMYCPGSSKICEHNGKQYVNSWSRAILNETSDLHVSQLLDVFFRWILKDDKKRQIFITILQHIVKNPGKRLTFCPVLQGAQGMGKTFIKQFMQAILGSANVQTISTDSIQDNLTDWAGRTELTVVEEIYIPGRRRFETIERFKQYISNPEISIRVAYTGTKHCMNPTSYLALTNHKDAIPIDCNHDRRYWVIFSDIQKREQIAEQDNAYGGENKFFDMLWPLIDKQPGACKQWLLSQTPYHNFNHAVLPYKTDDMFYMEQQSKHYIEEEIESILHEKPRGVYTHVFSSTVIMEHIEIEGYSKNSIRTPMSKILQKNWIRCGQNHRPSIDGKKHSIWHDGTVGHNNDAVALWKKLYSGEMSEDETNVIPFERPRDDD